MRMMVSGFHGGDKSLLPRTEMGNGASVVVKVSKMCAVTWVANVRRREGSEESSIKGRGKFMGADDHDHFIGDGRATAIIPSARFVSPVDNG